MTVRELLQMVWQLRRADPEAVIFFDSGADTVMLLNARPGLHQEISEAGECQLSARDTEFLRILRISA